MLYIKVLILSTCSDPVEEAHGSRSSKKKKERKIPKITQLHKSKVHQSRRGLRNVWSSRLELRRLTEEKVRDEAVMS